MNALYIWIKHRFKYVAVCAVYVLGGIVLGEKLPFSRFEMYNYMPNWAYVFYIEKDGEPVYFNSSFTITKNAGFVAHLFYNYMKSKNYTYGYGNEEPQALQETGTVMMQFIFEGEQPTCGQYTIWRKHLWLDNTYQLQAQNTPLATYEVDC